MFKSKFNNDYYKPFHNYEDSNNKNKKWSYRLTYCGHYIYQLTKGKYKVLIKTYSFKDIYYYIKENNIDLKSVYLPYMNLYDFLSYWVSFEEEDKKRCSNV